LFEAPSKKINLAHTVSSLFARYSYVYSKLNKLEHYVYELLSVTVLVK